MFISILDLLRNNLQSSREKAQLQVTTQTNSCQRLLGKFFWIQECSKMQSGEESSSGHFNHGSSSAVRVPWEIWLSHQDTSSLVTSAPWTNKGGPRLIQNRPALRFIMGLFCWISRGSRTLLFPQMFSLVKILASYQLMLHAVFWMCKAIPFRGFLLFTALLCYAIQTFSILSDKVCCNLEVEESTVFQGSGPKQVASSILQPGTILDDR